MAYIRKKVLKIAGNMRLSAMRRTYRTNCPGVGIWIEKRSLNAGNPVFEGLFGLSELPKKLTLNKLALIGKAEKSP